MDYGNSGGLWGEGVRMSAEGQQQYDRYEMVVLGAGYAGLMTALRLRPQRSVIERLDAVKHHQRTRPATANQTCQPT